MAVAVLHFMLAIRCGTIFFTQFVDLFHCREANNTNSDA
jgi:hypothetical protein